MHRLVLAWAETALRDLPWRRTRDPWSILVSETMLQQTQVVRVVDRYVAFLERFPTPQDCAEATPASVIEAWAGLGFNRRAVNLHKAARAIVAEHDGRVPAELDALRSLPGVGPYTARAVQVFAFEQHVAVLDTNVGRLLARWTGEPLSAGDAQTLADDLVPAGESWRWNQALFDFGSSICTKRDPHCGDCVVRPICGWSGDGADPAVRSAGVSGGQSKFAGSDRQVRGRIVDALRTAPLALPEDVVLLGRVTDTIEDLERIIDTLIEDGLAVRSGPWLRLPS